MTSIGHSTDSPLPPLHGDNYLNHTRGFGSWLVTLDHKRIGLMYLAAVTFFLFVGGIFAILLRAELYSGGSLWPALSAEKAPEDTYNQMFTLHGSIMVFLFIIPAIPAAMGNFVLPIMLGAKDVAFPRLNLLSYYIYVFGALFFIGALVAGGLDTGWTFYTPYSTSTDKGSPFHWGIVLAVSGAFILGFSSILTGVNFLSTIHMLRPPGMSWFRIPLMLWALYATSVIQILATPVLAITLMLLIVERTLGFGIFDPAKGGDPVLFQHFFWFYSHPAVYIMILPAMGIISEVISTFCHKAIFGYKFIACSSLAIALVGFLVWGHHMFTSGQSGLVSTFFALLTFLVAIPSAIKVFNWLATMYRGSIDLRTPMLWAMSFIWVFTIGGLTGLFLGAVSVDVHLHDTYFVVAHFHYVMVGGTLFAFMAGMHYWFPKMFGRMYSEAGAQIAWVIVFIGFNATFLSQFVGGSRGMPRRYADFNIKLTDLGFDQTHAALFDLCQKISTIGSYVLGVGLVWGAIVLLNGLIKGRRAPSNPWGGPTLEWRCASPPIHENFKDTPTVGDPYDYTGMKYDAETENYYFSDENSTTAST